MKKPLIGIVGNIITSYDDNIGDMEKFSISLDYIKAVEKAGGIPIILPIVAEEETIKLQLLNCDGIILGGGYDIHPKFYKDEPHKEIGFMREDIDEYQFKLLKIFLEEDKPILGICKGCQLLNVFLNGDLYQDLSEYPEEALMHIQKSRKYEQCHNIKIKENSKLFNLFGENIMVNSFHHQCLKNIGKGLEVTALSKDGIVEAIELKDKRFVIGVQWHPEMMLPKSNIMLNLFKELINNCI